jgi:hypothetical protein
MFSLEGGDYYYHDDGYDDSVSGLKDLWPV